MSCCQYPFFTSICFCWTGLNSWLDQQKSSINLNESWEFPKSCCLHHSDWVQGLWISLILMFANVILNIQHLDHFLKLAYKCFYFCHLIFDWHHLKSLCFTVTTSFPISTINLDFCYVLVLPTLVENCC